MASSFFAYCTTSIMRTYVLIKGGNIMKFERENEKDKYDRIYRKGYNNDIIVKQFPYLSKFEVLNMIQKIFALDQIKTERGYIRA